MILNLKNKIHSIINTKFVRNVATVATGSIAMQAITIAFSPIITRIYGPESFGILGVFITLSSFITPIVTLTYVTAIVLPAEENEAIGVARLSFFSAFVITLISIVVFIVLKNNIVEIFNLQTVAPYLFLLPIVIFFTASVQIYNQWLIRENQYKAIARVSVINSLIINLSKVVIGLFYSTAAVLIFIVSIGSILYSQMFRSPISHEVKKKLRLSTIFKKQAIDDYLQLGKKFKDFPLYRAPQVLFNSFTKGIPLLLLAYFSGPTAAGFFSLSNRVLNMPAEIIGKSIGNVYYPRIAKAANNQESLKPYIFKATVGMSGLVFVPLIIIVILGPQLFEFVFGVDWTMAGHYARWLFFSIFFEFILNPSKDALIVMGFQKYLLIFEILFFVFKTGALIGGFLLLKNDLLAIIVFSFTGMVLSILFLLLVFYKSGRNLEKVMS